MSAAGTGGRGGERGAASVLVGALMAVLLLVGSALAVVAAMFVEHRRAQSAADLAAIAGATVLQRGEDACAEAGTVALANGARLRSCTVDGWEVVVGVEVSGPRWLGQSGDLVGEARAGPAR